jgi:inhibitor of KinA sporulation pathway (predicted exonuclease)
MIEKILVVDFEATCENEKKIEPQEIIEFPCIIIDIETQRIEIEKVFHYYIKPKSHPILSQFCTQLTGIMQNTVDNADTFDIVYLKFLDWLMENNLNPYDGNNFIFLSCGDWDFRTCIRENAKIYNIKLPNCFNKWINIKQAYTNLTKTKISSMPDLIQKYDLILIGHHHSGIDDARNIANCAIHMLKKFNWQPIATYKLKE